MNIPPSPHFTPLALTDHFNVLHVVETCTINYQAGFADDRVDGNELGDLVAYHRRHQRMHQQGLTHQHTPVQVHHS